MPKTGKMSVRKAKAISNMFGKSLLPNMSRATSFNAAALSILSPQLSLEDALSLSNEIEAARKVLSREKRTRSTKRRSK